MNKLSWLIVNMGTVFAAGVVGIVFHPFQLSYGVALPQGTALFETSLQSRISSTDTSMTLVANSVSGGGSLSGYNCFTIDEGRTDAEFVCGSISGTTVSSLERGLSLTTGTTTVTALEHAHRVGADVKITDFPLIQRLRNQNNGDESYPNVLNYTYSPDYTNASTTALVSYGLLQKTSFAGTVNADDTTKGIVEMATGAEAALATSLGGTGARLALGANLGTSTPYNSGSRVIPVTGTNEKLSQLFLDLTAGFTWTGSHIFTATSTHSGIVIPTGYRLGIGTTSPYTALSIVGETVASYFTATTTASSTFPNLVVSGNASTSLLRVSNGCVGCLLYAASSTNFSVSSGTLTDAGSVPTDANYGIVQYSINTGQGIGKGTSWIARLGLTTATISFHDDDGNTTGAEYTLSISGNDFVVTESNDDSSTVSGTAYWYK